MRRRWRITCLGQPIQAWVTALDEGYDVALYGGCRTHMGAVGLARPDGGVELLERAGHRDGVVAGRWAATLAAAWRAPVCVRCGIHYDGVDKRGIEQIVAACAALLKEVEKGGGPK